LRRWRQRAPWAPLALLLFLGACAQVAAPRAPATGAPSAVEKPIYSQAGLASWYGASGQNALTASGEPFDPKAMTAAHPSLPFGTVIRVTRISNGRTVKVRVNDRGPFANGRIIDLSVSAARSLGMIQAGEAEVRIEEFASDQT